MRWAIIFFLVLLIIFWYGKKLSDEGRLSPLLIKYLPRQSAAIEYHWANLAALLNNRAAARYHFDIVISTFSSSGYLPLALIGRAEVYERFDRKLAIEEYKKFLQTYPDHPKSPMIIRRLELLEQ